MSNQIEEANFLPYSADVVIIGGGVLGCSIAYALSRLIHCKVLLLERYQLATGFTNRSAGLLTQARPQEAVIPLVKETFAAIERLQEQPGENLPVHRVGSLHLAVSPQKKRELTQLLDVANQHGIEGSWITLEEVRRRVPWLDHEDWNDSAATFFPQDAFIDAYILTHAYAKAARRQGVHIFQEVCVLEILRSGNKIRGVITDRGVVACPVVIDAAGAWAGLIAWQIGIGLPIAPVRSHYWVTAPQAIFPGDQSIVILPDARAYTRPEAGGLLFGIREEHGVSVDPRLVPGRLNGYVIGEDPSGWEPLLKYSDLFQAFFPAFDEVEIAHYIAGLSTYTPDGLFALGGFPGLDGFLAATGCCGAGVAASGGIGLALAELTLGMTGSFDLKAFDINRFGAVNPLDRGFRQLCADARAKKDYG